MRLSWTLRGISSSRFQFTHPGRGATVRSAIFILVGLCFNSRTPGGVRLCSCFPPPQTSRVSIHAPREGCDVPEGFKTWLSEFQFTHPGRGATAILYLGRLLFYVSIHAPREGCDGFRHCRGQGLTEFQFTHPGRGATGSNRSPRQAQERFNSRTPGGVRRRRYYHTLTSRSFNSRTPGGVRQYGAKLPIMGRINKRNLRLAVLL